MKYKKKFVLVSIFLFLCSLFNCDGIKDNSELIIDEIKPGPYKAGYQRFTWEDINREEFYTLKGGDNRHVVLDIFYPTEVEPDDPDDAKENEHPGS